VRDIHNDNDSRCSLLTASAPAGMLIGTKRVQHPGYRKPAGVIGTIIFTFFRLLFFLDLVDLRDSELLFLFLFRKKIEI
jgi:hypothetical protein